MTDKLSLYNGALVDHLGVDPLDALTDDLPVRYSLDNVWDRDAVDTCLELGQWNFAARSVRLEFESSITPEFGYQYAFTKPNDFIRTMGVCSDEYFDDPLEDYTDESGFWWADIEPLYVRYVSNDSQYGLDYSKWPRNFTRMVESWLAMKVSKLSTYAEKRKEILEDHKELLRQARSTDAMEQASRKNPAGSWTRSRRGYLRNELGKTNRLIG